MSKGWIALHRSMLDHWVFEDAERLKAWLTILMVVNHEGKKTLIKGKLMDCSRGESLLSHASWAKKFGKGWNRQKVIRFFKLLESDSMIEQVNEQVTTRLRVNNYAQYQDTGNKKRTRNDTVSDTPDVHQADTERTPDDTQLNNVNNDNNVTSKDKGADKPAPKRKPVKRFVVPSLADIKLFALKNNITLIDPEYFFNYYVANGWKVGSNKMKSWEMTLKNWELREKKKITPIKTNQISSTRKAAERFING